MRSKRTMLSNGSAYTPKSKFSGALKTGKSEFFICRVESYDMSNLLAVIAAVGSFIGGLIILIYLMSEQYFPQDIGVSSIGLLLAAAAITGIFFTIVFALYLVFPGFIYRQILSEQDGGKSLGLLADSVIIWVLDIPSLLIPAALITFFLFRPSGFEWLCLLATTPLLLALFYRKGRELLHRHINDLNRWVRLLKLGVVFWILSVWAITFFSFSILLLLIGRYAQTVQNEAQFWVAFLLMWLAMIVANHLVAATKKGWFTLVVAVLLLVLFLIPLKQFDFISKGVVRLLSLGNMSNVTLLLDMEGCQIARQFVRPATVAMIASTAPALESDVKYIEISQQKSPVCSLSPVNLIWRIGSEYFVDANQAKLDFLSVNNNKIVAYKKVQNKHKKVLSVRENKAIDKSLMVKVKNNRDYRIKFSIPSGHVLSWAEPEQRK